jgi:hypothetical protein
MLIFSESGVLLLAGFVALFCPTSQVAKHPLYLIAVQAMVCAQSKAQSM